MSASKKLLPSILAVAIFIDTLDSTIVSVAIPAIAQNFHISPVNMKLALTSYLLSLAIFIPISGWLGDRFGDKKMFIIAMSAFTISSLLCAFSPNLPFLITARMIQGFGGALMIPIGRLILLRAFTKAEFGKAISAAIVPGLLGPALGPTIGGLILHITTWHWIFLINVPLGLLGIILSIFLIQKTALEKTTPFNWIGFILFSLGLTLITVSLALVGDNFDLIHDAIFLGLGAVILLYGYWKISNKQLHPLLNIKLFQQKTFRISMLVSFIARPSLGALPFLLPLLLQIVWQKTPLYSGTIFMFFALGMLSARYLVGQKILKQYGYRMGLLTFILSFTILLFSLGWFTQPTSVFYIIPILYLLGVFSSQFYTTIGTMSIVEMGPEHYSQSVSISSTVQQFAAGVGIAFAAILLHVVSLITHQPLFSSEVFMWTFMILSTVNLFSLVFVLQLNSELKLE